MNKSLLMYYLGINNCSITSMAKEISISRQSLQDKIAGRTDFKVSEIVKIKGLLKLNANEIDNIFFKEKVS